MPQDPFTAAIIGAAAIIVAQIVGQSIATFFGTRAAARINQLGAVESARIQQATQERVARERDRREWRRSLIQPMLDEAERRRRLFIELGWAIEVDAFGSEEAGAPASIRSSDEVFDDLRLRDNMLIAPRFRVAGSEEMARAYETYEEADRALFSVMYVASSKGAPMVNEIIGDKPEQFGAALVHLHQAAEHYIYDEGRPATSA